MRSFKHIILAIAFNALGLFIASMYVSGFSLKPDLVEIIQAGALLTVLNMLLKPILKLFLGPFIILTLGVGILFVNAIILYLLDILTVALTIETITALTLATLVLATCNVVYHILTQ